MRLILPCRRLVDRHEQEVVAAQLAAGRQRRTARLPLTEEGVQGLEQGALLVFRQGRSAAQIQGRALGGSGAKFTSMMGGLYFALAPPRLPNGTKRY